MIINFKRYINTTILVSMPMLYHDSKCRPFKLLGVELPGLWLQSDELTTLLLPDDMQQYASAGPVVFVPFAHTVGILVPTARSATAAPAAATTSPAPTAETRAPAPAKSGTSSKTPRPKKS